ncbi:MAG: GNAT family N-acetyltransferase [Clostridia bacterium]|nr:GNAT family N-acetyltransferase [Clostridia bacterium]
MRIETPRLLLRPLEEADLTAFSAYVMDATLSRMYGLPVGMDHDTAAKIFQAFLRGGKTSALVLRKTGCMIGHLMAVPPELPAEAMTRLDGKQGVTLAYAISPGHQRQGLAFEALSAAIDHLFRQGMDYVHCGYYDFNLPSRRLQEKLGFQPFGTHSFQRQDGTITIMDNILFKA